MIAFSHSSSARSRSGTTRISSEVSRMRAECVLNLARHVHEHELRAALIRRLLDLREAVRGRRVDPGHQPKIEQQETTIRLPRQQRLDVLIQPVGRAEEQIALQAHALQFLAVLCQDRELLRPAIERRVVFGAVEAEFDGVDPACAERERGAADHHADQEPGNKPPHDDDQRRSRAATGIRSAQAGAPKPPASDRAGRRRGRTAARPARISAHSRESPDRARGLRPKSPRP